MTRNYAIFGTVFLLSSLPSTAEEISQSRTLEETLAFSGSGKGHLIVDNIFGSVVVSGHASDSVVMVARETRSADSDEGIERSWREVDLKIFERDGEIEFFVDGPFRGPENQRRWFSWKDDGPTYWVQYDFEIRVPNSTDFTLKTVNEGDIEVSDVRGDFEVSNVNGSVRLLGLAGSGAVETVNGEITARFASNPSSDSRFVTVNGEVEAQFQPGLAADLELKSRWGEMWTEYPVVALPSAPPTTKSQRGRTVIEFNHGNRVRVGAGGPTLYFETLNGDIYVRRSTG